MEGNGRKWKEMEWIGIETMGDPRSGSRRQKGNAERENEDGWSADLTMRCSRCNRIVVSRSVFSGCCLLFFVLLFCLLVGLATLSLVPVCALDIIGTEIGLISSYLDQVHSSFSLSLRVSIAN